MEEELKTQVARLKAKYQQLRKQRDLLLVQTPRVLKRTSMHKETPKRAANK